MDVRILGNDLDITNVQAKPDEESAYFMIESTGLNVSVFIEPVGKCKVSEDCRDYVLGLGNPAWGRFQDLVKSKIKDFSCFEFYRSEVQGQPLKVLDMYAEYVAQGYWIDVHISKVQFKKEEHALFENAINSISFVSKSGQQNAAFDSAIANGEKASAAWLDMWDKMKCRESYGGLSPISREGVDEKQWVDYCTVANKALGKNMSRKLIAVAFTRSLPPKTDRPVGVIAYHSSFANRASVVEIMGVIFEKNGTLSVTNYLTP